MIKKAVTSCFEITANLIGKLKVSIATKCIDQIPIFNAIAVKRALCALRGSLCLRCRQAYGSIAYASACPEDSAGTPCHRLYPGLCPSRMRVRARRTQREKSAIAPPINQFLLRSVPSVLLYPAHDPLSPLSPVLCLLLVVNQAVGLAQRF